MVVVEKNDITEESSTTLANNLKYLSTKHGIHEAEICRQIGCTVPTLNRVFRGINSDPKVSLVKKLAKLFNVPMSALLSENLIKNGINTDYLMIPTLEWEEAKNLKNISKSLTTEQNREWVPITCSISQNSFALKTTSAFEPRYASGTLFIVDPEAKPMDGDILIIKNRHENKVTAKILMVDPSKWKLFPLNSERYTLFKSDEHQIIGVVMEKRFNQQRGA